ncbi:MAG: hypothetical protein ABI811_19950 [Acidobacteriota bacterium]
MMEFLTSIEQLRFSTWVREGGAIYGYATILFLHVIGLALVCGPALMISLRLLGLTPSMEVKPLERLYPVMWSGFWLNLITGTMLLMADATTKMRNPTFGIKMALVVAGLIIQTQIRKQVFHNPLLATGALPSNAKMLAWASMLCWLGAIIAGRLLAYLGPVAGLA